MGAGAGTWSEGRADGKSSRRTDGGKYDGPARRRGADHGALAPWQARGAAAPPRPGQPMYTGEQFQRLLVENGVICSMSPVANAWDVR